MAVADGRVSIASGCSSTRARERDDLAGTRLRVRFESLARPGLLFGGDFVGDVRGFYGGGGGRRSRCEGAKGVRVELWIDPACETMTGRLRARSPLFDREFVATLAPPS